MQKKLLGMAVAAALAMPAVALAQSAVQVYGTVHLSVNQAKYTDSTDQTTANAVQSTTKYGVTSHASNWGLRSTETLGAGMTAWFQVEFNMKMARDNGVFDGDSTARNSGVGLRGNFGNVYLGTWETPWSQTFRLWDVGTIGGWGPVTSIIGRREQTGTNPSRNCANNTGAAGQAALPVPPICGNGSESTNGPNGNLGYSLWRRYNYAVFYESPLFAGVQLKVAFQPNERKANFTNPDATHVNENPSSWSGSLTWTGLGGRARAFGATMQNKDWSNVGATDGGFTVGGGYDFGVVNVGVTYEDYTYKPVAGDMKAKEWAVGIAVPLGPGKIGASYAKAKKLSGDGVAASEAAGTNDTAAKMWNIGYEWALSKRTALGFGIAKIDNGANQAFAWTASIPVQNGWQSGAVPAGVDTTNIFVSMRHSF
ncbi:MAG TPA: porin [Burkholderiales bacterium]|nr:porin [Burkholderiales bacterium]